MNSKIKKIISEEVERFFMSRLNEDGMPDNLIQKVKSTESETRDGDLSGADDEVIRLVWKIQQAIGLTGGDLDGIYGPVTHGKIMNAQGPYEPDS